MRFSTPTIGRRWPKIACKETGSNETAMLAHRKRWPDFERRLQAARAIGSKYCGRRLPPMSEAQREAGEERRARLEARLGPARMPTIREMINIARRAKAEETMRRRREDRQGRGGAGGPAD